MGPSWWLRTLRAIMGGYEMEKVLEGLSKLGTSAISDAMDKLGIVGTCQGIKPLDHTFRMVGQAFTVKYDAAGCDGGNVGDYIDDVIPGQVVVLDNRGRLDCTVWGDILTGFAHQHNIAGTLIDGVCRDTNRSRELDYPIFSAGCYMRTGKERVSVSGTNVPVTVGKVRVRPGDVVIGDADGVVVVPVERADGVLRVAQAIEDAEQNIREAVSSGMPLRDARKIFRYHELQNKE